MNPSRTPMSPWYARRPLRQAAIAASVCLATLAVVLAYERAAPLPFDAPNVAVHAASDAYRDPSLPALSFRPNVGDAQQPAPPTF